MSDPINQILNAYPASFFQRVLEYVDSGFGEAHTLVGRHIDDPEKANMLGQLRHARCEAGFRKAAEESGLDVYAPHTTPSGSRYSLVAAKDVCLIRGNIQKHCGAPRPTAFRKAWAALNQWLEPLQLDLLDMKSRPPADRLCGMIVTTANSRHGNPSIPAFVGLGIPWADLSGWAMLMPITDLLARYHDEETKVRTPQETPVEVKDRAIPKLKKKTNDQNET
jgi:hypothetical protein